MIEIILFTQKNGLSKISIQNFETVQKELIKKRLFCSVSITGIC